MKRELYEKMNQWDRIEYSIDHSSIYCNHNFMILMIGLSFIFGILGLAGFINKDYTMAFDTFRLMVLTLGVGYIINILIDSVSHFFLDKQYIKRLDIKPKK